MSFDRRSAETLPLSLDTREIVQNFFGSLKSDRLHWRSYQTREEARGDTVDYSAMFYNSRRLHSTLGYQSPDAFEANSQMAKAS